jgi:carbon storage regulator
MLVLSRKKDETIMIGDSIAVTIVDIRGDKVRIGVAAPTAVPVHRLEVFKAIQRENSIRDEAPEQKEAERQEDSHGG